jgi:Holliday junction resolvase
MTPNANYERGRRFEYEMALKFRRKGWWVTRGAGSHGADLVCIPPHGGKIIVAELKLGYFNKENYRNVSEMVSKSGGIFRIICKEKGDAIKWVAV